MFEKTDESVIIKAEGLYRNAKNTGAFSKLSERMNKKHIRSVAKECGIDLKGITLNIDAQESLLLIPYAGRTDYENIGQITFFPNVFKTREELVITLFLENYHVEQFKNMAQKKYKTIENIMKK